MMSKTRRTSPALTATQIIPERVTSSLTCRSGDGFRGGRFDRDGDGLPSGREAGRGPVDGLGTGSAATFVHLLKPELALHVGRIFHRLLLPHPGVPDSVFLPGRQRLCPPPARLAVGQGVLCDPSRKLAATSSTCPFHKRHPAGDEAPHRMKPVKAQVRRMSGLLTWSYVRE